MLAIIDLAHFALSLRVWVSFMQRYPENVIVNVVTKVARNVPRVVTKKESAQYVNRVMGLCRYHEEREKDQGCKKDYAEKRVLPTAGRVTRSHVEVGDQGQAELC